MKIFLSYSRDDAGNFAKHIHKFMRDKGHDIFIDVNSIWSRSIEKNISKCDLFVVIVTPDALSSSYVEKEVLEAQEQDKIIVPCIHEQVEYNEIKWGLERKQGINFSDKYDLALNLYPQIKNYETKFNENPSFQDDVIEDTNAASFWRKGMEHERMEYYEEAIECYDKAIEIDPTFEDAYIKKGNALTYLDKYEEAIEWFDKALELNPNNEEAQDDKKMALEDIKEKSKKRFLGIHLKKSKKRFFGFRK